LPPAAAGVREVRVGSCVVSAIGEGDEVNEDGIRYEDWRLPLAAGERVEIDLDSIAPPRPPSAPRPPSRVPEPVSRGFDTFLELRRDGAVVDSNDDRPGSYNSRIEFTAPAAGDYVVRARPLFAGSGGYVLSVRRLEPQRLPLLTPLVEGRNPVSPPIAGGASLQARRFTFDGRAGERVRVALRRQGFGDQLRLAIEGEVLGAAGELDPALTLSAVLPRDGRYLVLALVHAAGAARGPSELSFERFPPVPPRPPTAIRPGETMEGELGLQSPAEPDAAGAFALAEQYALDVAGGEVLTVTLESEAFDPVLAAGTLSPLGFASAASDDDGGGGVNSRLVLRPSRPGSLVLRVEALGRGMGRFRLRVVHGETAPPAAPAATE
jgi:hypothetical protein